MARVLLMVSFLRSLCFTLSVSSGLGYAERLEDLQTEAEEEEKRGDGATTYRVSCPWKYTTGGRLLSLVGVGLILVAIVTCCCSGLLSDEVETTNQETVTKKREVLHGLTILPVP